MILTEPFKVEISKQRDDTEKWNCRGMDAVERELVVAGKGGP